MDTKEKMYEYSRGYEHGVSMLELNMGKSWIEASRKYLETCSGFWARGYLNAIADYS